MAAMAMFFHVFCISMAFGSDPLDLQMDEMNAALMEDEVCEGADCSLRLLQRLEARS